MPSQTTEAGPRDVPILTYHSLDDSGSVISIRPADFSWQVHDLRRRGYTGMSLCDLAAARRGERAWPARPVVLTFDDGFANLMEHAIEPLRATGFSATVFVVADRLGSWRRRHDNRWPGQPPSIPILPLLVTSELEELRSAGIEIGCHSRSHPVLPQLGEAEVQQEIFGAKDDLESTLGDTVSSFAYPYGQYGEREWALVTQAFDAACGTRLGFSAAGEDLRQLSRLDMYYLRQRRSFTGFDRWPGRLRLVVRRLARSTKAQLTPKAAAPKSPEPEDSNFQPRRFP